MARKYTKVEHLISIIEERTKAGETYREIGASLGLTREEVCGAMHRHHAKERKLAAGYIPRPKGRPRKEPVSEEAKKYNEIVKLRMPFVVSWDSKEWKRPFSISIRAARRASLVNMKQAMMQAVV